MLRHLFLLLIAVMLVGCKADDWRTADISDKLPSLDFELVDENGRTVTEQDYAGKPALVFFGYTHCPDVCPTTLARLMQITRQLDASDREAFRVLFVSVDPKRDTPQTLTTYTNAFGPQFIGLTGDKEQLDDVTNRFRVSYSYGEPDADGNYDVSHAAAVIAFDARGNAQFLTRDSDPVEAVKADLEHLIDASRG
ncbi:SCO family protein [Marinobacter bohaiensis]|uniref:SCO family protein n=1 Tax=Marinobacter bohaiensis TaxID=2201898 RepID=UPI000DAEFB87|nr:SCO family protein [Marinobacter bohaiensis]